MYYSSSTDLRNLSLKDRFFLSFFLSNSPLEYAATVLLDLFFKTKIIMGTSLKYLAKLRSIAVIYTLGSYFNNITLSTFHSGSAAANSRPFPGSSKQLSN